MPESLMPSIKKIRGVIQSFAQHTLSGPCHDSPERNLQQRQAGILCISIPLIGQQSLDAATSPNSLLQESKSLSDRFLEFLAKEKIDLASIASAQASFLFKGQCRTPNSCHVTVEAIDGTVVERTAHEMQS